ncbi:MAG: hypothetical protein HS116_20290 [Planctomycetes bacterium]|nr:hypothetical protein [Planctomycetota bacterium]
MARPKAADDAGDSLELLLDTMCNAFGGIIFITFMVVLVPKGSKQSSMDKPEHDSPAESVALECEEDLKAKAEALELELASRQRERASQAEIRYARLPRLREVNKGMYFLVLSGGKAYLPMRADSAEYNTADFTVARNGATVSCTPIPERGTEIAAWLAEPDGLRALLTGLPRDRVMIHVALYSDSVSLFAKVRAAITDAGFDYNWTPLAKGDALKLTTGSGPAEAQ